MLFTLANSVGYGHIENIQKILAFLSDHPKKRIILNWSKVHDISPAGFALLACLSDLSREIKCPLSHLFVKKPFQAIPVVREITRSASSDSLPAPQVYDSETADAILRGIECLNPMITETISCKFRHLLSEEQDFSCRLILNELMQNSIDHSGAERSYIYAGMWKKTIPHEIHLGVVDMGVSIPAKMEQKYRCPNDVDYLKLALEAEITTRRKRPGGFGLHLAFEHLKNLSGTLTIHSRSARLIRYFKNKRVVCELNRYPVRGAWCMARIPLVR